ncbi:MAG: hypothetical protein IPH06_03835 [Alphaproteobacteria bacterium]|nr:hypothetical protein [Alphaproteobacteria bacterium]QQS57167.1 MAG: hypothetical protein IPN28_13150 [Alphaproteobacteria bacterium]
MGDCNDNSCSTEICDSGKGSCDSGKSEECTWAEDLLCLAKCAKHELLKEKMKKELEAKMGKKLDAVAKVAVEAMLKCIEHKMEAMEACHDYKDKLYAALKS